MDNRIVILDFGSQYTKLIARRVREMSVYSEIVPYDVSLDELRSPEVKGIILSGGPRSVLQEGAPSLDPAFWEIDKPVLGICYGLQLMCHGLGGHVAPASDREYGPATLTRVEGVDHPLFKGIKAASRGWMGHGDRLEKAPENFVIAGSSENAPITAMVHKTRPYMGIQFHPEVSHTEMGATLLSNFVFDVCQTKADWLMTDYIDRTVKEIREQVGNETVLLGLSGGVDSAVAAVLIHKAIGDQLTCVYVDHGMMRKDETEKVVSTFQKNIGINLVPVDASDIFLGRLKDVSDPEQKRKIIGRTFIEVFESEAAKLDHPHFLAQGTLYPDVIESASHDGPAQTIKSHHNVGGLPEKMKMELLEPLRELFKDEVRVLGRELGLPEVFVGRHPFPGPGLAIRIPGDITEEKADILRKADAVYLDEIRKAGLYDEIWQAFAVLLPVRTVGVMGDGRTYDYVCALRAVTSTDGMTADYYDFSHEFLGRTATRIINEVRGINRVVYDITSKPPGTIEWE